MKYVILLCALALAGCHTVMTDKTVCLDDNPVCACEAYDPRLALFTDCTCHCYVVRANPDDNGVPR